MIDVSKIKQLREKTGAGIAECREALEKSAGDLRKAEVWLKEQGIAKAHKKAERQTNQGIIESYLHSGGKLGVLVELNCETDFVARTDEFKNLAHELAMQISAMSPKDVKDLLGQEYIRDPQMKIVDLIKSAIAKLGENIHVKRFTRIALGE
jgi:elongation factor Ts